MKNRDIWILLLGLCLSAWAAIAFTAIKLIWG